MSDSCFSLFMPVGSHVMVNTENYTAHNGKVNLKGHVGWIVKYIARHISKEDENLVEPRCLVDFGDTLGSFFISPFDLELAEAKEDVSYVGK